MRGGGHEYQRTNKWFSGLTGWARKEGVAARVCGGGVAVYAWVDWRAMGRCEQRRVKRGVARGEVVQHAR